MFWWLPVSTRGNLLPDQETVRVHVLLLLVFTQKPPLVQNRGLPRRPTHEETALQQTGRDGDGVTASQILRHNGMWEEIKAAAQQEGKENQSRERGAETLKEKKGGKDVALT